MLLPHDVFTPGKLPIEETNIYARRTNAERDLEKAFQRGVVPVVYGEYGVGKTTLARYFLRDHDRNNRLVNIESAADKSLEDVLARCLEKVGYRVAVSQRQEYKQYQSHEQSAESGIESGFAKAVVASRRVTGNEAVESVEESLVVTSPTDSRVIEVCDELGIVLLIDELHRASSRFSSDLSKFIKTVGNSNCKKFRVVLLGTSSDSSRLVGTDPGIDRLILEIHLRSMTESESRSVVVRGMQDLGIKISDDAVDRIVKLSVGSPYILQYLALEVSESAFEREPRTVGSSDIDSALASLVDTRMQRLKKAYLTAVESTGEIQYRKQILRAMAESEDEYVTMEDLRTRVGEYLKREVPSTALSGPLGDLKKDKYGGVLRDVNRSDGESRLTNYSSFSDPSLKAFIRLQLIQEAGGLVS